ncbi:nuclear undecaprenyl pyrophosphate synthase-like protein [Zalerion maritima]|uniref:ditrans,polycis-polyprenyl diphosphate synthase [(2E,6E)-farnesyldiphosphate specific] n=1 Tax=Zalerion maritima TaxID=339359 RepID=A0AAD5S0Z9_9PEZI|nr:nuclear undecaprenyl pyrophosphate synthase-like protein [Zalerion maritima]
MPSRTMDARSTSVPVTDLGDKKTREHLKRLEPYLLDRTERKRQAAKEAQQQRKISQRNSIPPPKTSSASSSRFGVRRFIRSQIHLLTFAIIHIVFSIYIRIRQAYHTVLDKVVSVFAHHHNTPELIQRDVSPLTKLPKHLSVVLKLEDHGRGAGLEKLVNEVANIAAWCASAGIPVLSVYERSGILKSYLPETHRAASQRLSLFFGRDKPALSLGAPHLPSIVSATSATSAVSPTPSSESSDSGFEDDNGNETNSGFGTTNTLSHLQILLLSEEDGRDSIVDLTKTLAEMSQRGKLSPNDISVDVVDAELKEGVVGDPDLLVIFGPYPDLAGYPPWQLRLTEIFCLRDNMGVGYQVFLKGLYKYANAEMRWGR